MIELWSRIIKPPEEVNSMNPEEKILILNSNPGQLMEVRQDNQTENVLKFPPTFRNLNKGFNHLWNSFLEAW